MLWMLLRFGLNHQALRGGSPPPPPSGSFLLLRDNTSYFLLRDGVSKLQLGY